MNVALKKFMRWSIFLFFFSFSSINSFAQSPNLISYQTVIRNSNNELVANATVGMRISILSGTAADVLWYQEEHTVKTNLNGLAYVVIGKGTNLNGIMTEIDWSKGPFYIKSESDPNGGKNYTLIVVSQLLSVPYAIYAKSAEKVTGPITELDPQFNASIAKSITAADTALWNTETDPLFSKSISNGITESDISFWNNKLSSFGETDPSFNISIAKGITAVDTAYWNKKLSSFAETDPSFNTSIAKGITAVDTAKWNSILDLSDTDDIADLAITNAKITGIVGSKVIGDIAGNAANVTGTVAVGNGGTGATSLTGYVKGNGSSAMTAVSSIPVADVTGAVKKVNGTLPDSSGEVTILFGRVTTGNYAGLPTSGGVNGDIYIVSGDVVNTSNNGRTFIKDDISWNEISLNIAATDARYLRLGGGTMEGSLNFPTGKTLILTDAPTGSTDAANKGYVDAKISSEVPNASDTTIGKIQLAGDLGGTASSPTVPGLALKAPINNPAFTGTVTGVTKTMVDLGNVDNTSDVNKPVSLATQTALDLKENASNKSDATLGTSTILYPTQNAVKTYVDSQVASGAPDATSSVKGKIQLAGDLGGSASSPTVPGLALKAPINNPAFTGTVTGITKAMVDLGNVDNTSDVNKPVSSATQTALDLKENASNKSDASLGTSTILYPTQNAVKTYVDSQVASGAPDATSSVKGKIQLAGDLDGTAALPSIKTSAITTSKLSADAVTSAKIADGEIINADISTSAAIADSKLATIAMANKVSNSATTATNANTASAIVARDASGDFSAGTITATGFSGPLSGNASTATLAATATKLAATKNINGIAFDGSSDITVTADAGTLSGTTLKSTVVSSSLTSVGTLTNLTVTYPIAGSITGNAANVSGTVALLNGGTGATTAAAALTNLGAAPVASPTFTGTVTSPIYASAPQALTAGSTINWNPANGLNASVTLDQNSTLNFTSNPPAGSYGTLIVTQDATGSRIITLPSTANKVLGSTSTTTITLSTAANTKDILNFYYDGTNCYWNVGQGYGTAAASSTTNLATSVTGTLPVANGGTGAATLTGYVKGTGTTAMTASASIPVADVTGAAPLASPAFSGTPSLPTGTTGITQTALTNNTTLATTAYADAAAGAAVTGKQNTLTNSSGLAGALADETGTGLAVFATSPTLTTPNLGTPSTLVGTNITGTAAGLTAGTVTTNANLTGEVTSVGNATTLTNASVIAKVLTGYTAGAGTVASTDNILQAIQKLDGNDALKAPLASPAFSGTPSLPTGTTGVTQAAGNNTTALATTAYADAAAGAAVTGKQNTLTNSSGLAGALADETGTGLAVFATSPILTTPNLGTPSTLVGTNITGTAAGLTAGTVTTNANLTGEVTSVGNATTLTNASVIAKVLTGYAAGSGTVASTDNILQAIQKLDGNDALKAPLASPAFSGTPSLPTGTTGVTQTAGNNTTALATTQFVTSAVAAVAAAGVPYTGATGPVNLGTTYNLTVSNFTIGQGKTPASGDNLAIGKTALNNTTANGWPNIGLGSNSLNQTTDGRYNIGLGLNALYANTTGSNNIGIGFEAGRNASTSSNITAVGMEALKYESGAGNTAIGSYAGKPSTNAVYSGTTNSTFLGYNTTTGKTAEVTITNSTAIGYGAAVTASHTIQLGNTSVTDVKTSGALTTGAVTYPILHGTANQVLTTTGSGTLSWTTPSVAKPISDQFTATAAQTSFTLTQTPITNTTVSPNVKPNVWMYINGIRTNNLAYSISGTTVTYTAANNNSYTIVVGDRIQFDYAY